jgi:proline iminopeptidase
MTCATRANSIAGRSPPRRHLARGAASTDVAVPSAKAFGVATELKLKTMNTKNNKRTVQPITSTIPHPPVASRDEWLAARKNLLAHEKELTKQRDRVNAERRRIPVLMGVMNRLSMVIAVGSVCVVYSVGAQTPQSSIPRTSGVLTIGGTPHPYLAEGTGLPCIVVSVAPPSYAPLFSDRLKRRIRFIYVDFKNSWTMESPRNVEKITMDSLVDEVDQVRSALGLDKVCVLGHSAPGFVALEYALRHPDHVSHAIIVNVAPCFTSDFKKEKARFWEADASADRKAALKRNIERLPDDLLRTLSSRDAFAMRYVRNGPRYFYDPSYDFYWAWAGKHYSAEMLNHYLKTILADYDPRPRLASNTVPMFVALGRYDYDVPYYEWDRARKTTPRLTSHMFERSGHFSMIEESALFDDRLIRWLEASR